jgi:23S rRNA (adenine2030-N6)-methyltransferase
LQCQYRRPVTTDRAGAAMLSYQHRYHAGNHADVLKHTVLCALLSRLVAKDKPLRFIDTHAGAGGYDLRSAAARKNREHEQGIGRLFDASDAPPAVARWLALARLYNDGPALRHYPGSPWLARESLRPIDDAFLFELHPAEHRALKRACDGDRRVKVLREDGLTGCVGLVPPPSKRAVLLVDPSYELDNEHRLVIDAVAKVHKRFATGTIAIWYPVIERRWVERYERALRAAGVAAFATYELCVARETRDRGLKGSGVFIVNPPWQLDEDLSEALPWLAKKLDTDGGASYRAVG